MKELYSTELYSTHMPQNENNPEPAAAHPKYDPFHFSSSYPQQWIDDEDGKQYRLQRQDLSAKASENNAIEKRMELYSTQMRADAHPDYNPFADVRIYPAGWNLAEECEQANHSRNRRENEKPHP